MVLALGQQALILDFWLGTDRPMWLALLDVPLFISHRILGPRRTLPRARGAWALDSGGFSELSMYGEWRTIPQDYAKAVRRYMDEIGGLRWAAIQDWMCEPFMLTKTGLTLAEHQRRTVESYATLLDLAPDLPWVPVLQGWMPHDYVRHADQYEAAGLPLTRLVGVGSVCRRQGAKEGRAILRQLATLGYRLHGFGIKTTGLLLGAAAMLDSADSMAWSRQARYRPAEAGCTHTRCNHCVRFALRWRAQVLDHISRGEQQPILAGWNCDTSLLCAHSAHTIMKSATSHPRVR